MDRDDLFGFGMLGLIGAADAWDSSRGIAFSTFAYPRIRGAILDELRRLDFLPRGRRERVRLVDAAIAELEQAEGARPTPERIAEHLSWTPDEVDEALSSASAAVRTSIDAPTHEEGSGGLASMLLDPSSSDPVGSAEYDELKEALVDAIAELPDQEKTVITLYYADGADGKLFLLKAEELLLREIAEIIGVTESRVSQIHSRAIYRLNRNLLCPTAED